MLKLKPCPFCGGKMRLLGKDPLKIGIVMDCAECYIRVAIPWAYDAEHGIPAFNKRASGWIPCSDRLPDLYETVLVAYKGYDGELVYSVSERFQFNGKKGIRWSAIAGNTPSHWMPLPEPPEREEHHES